MIFNNGTYGRVRHRDPRQEGWFVVVQSSLDQDVGRHRLLCVDSHGHFHTFHEEDLELDHKFFDRSWFK